MKMRSHELTDKAIALLKDLISTPSFSSNEDKTALLIKAWLEGMNIPVKQVGNNIYAFNLHFDPAKPTLLLNSHHDTVQPNAAYTLDPFTPIERDGKIYGLGSNDAGGCLVSLMAAFTHFYPEANLNHNLILVASAEEETAGDNSIRAVLPLLPELDVAIIGEPTKLEMAISEKGLVVFDAVVKGTPSHAAHPNEDNAIYKAADVIQWFKDYRFEKVSPTLGAVKLTITQVNAGAQHNVVPSEVHLVLDVRVNDCYSNAAIAQMLQDQAPCEITPRSLRLSSSSISAEHPLVKSGLGMGLTTYGSPTLSDQAALSCPSMKLGPGDSLRSHSADEFIYREEIEKGVNTYIALLKDFLRKDLAYQ